MTGAAAWPPVYDDDYLPAPDQRYWSPERETMPPAAREVLILERLRRVVRWAWDRSPFYREKWTAAGVHPDHLRRLDDLHRFPVVTKAELLTSELVTNAVTHGAPPIHLAVRVDPGLVTVSVTDGSSEPPIMRDVQTTDSHGRGLRIVEALASQWGHTGHHVGKTVWCSLRY